METKSQDSGGQKHNVVSFEVTGEAMRPASKNLECFYCQSPIGSNHKQDCVLVKKKVTVRMTVEYEIEVPAYWDKDDVEFHRNEGSWCADNAIDELSKYGGEDGCICPVAEFEYLGNDSDTYLGEG